MLKQVTLIVVVGSIVLGVASIGATRTEFQLGRGTAFEKAAHLYHSKDTW